MPLNGLLLDVDAYIMGEPNSRGARLCVLCRRKTECRLQATREDKPIVLTSSIIGDKADNKENWPDDLGSVRPMATAS